VKSDGSLKNHLFNDRFFISCLKLLQRNLFNRSRKRVCFWLQFLHFTYTGSWPSQKQWNMVLSCIFVPYNLTLWLLVAFQCWKLFLWHAIILCLIKHELKRLDYERLLANVLCKQLIIEFSFHITWIFQLFHAMPEVSFVILLWFYVHNIASGMCWIAAVTRQVTSDLKVHGDKDWVEHCLACQAVSGVAEQPTAPLLKISWLFVFVHNISNYQQDWTVS